MLGLKRFRSLSIFTKVLLTFFLVIFPLFFLGLEIYSRAKTIVMNEISESAQSKIHFYLLSLENEIERNIHNKREFLNDTDLLTLSIAGTGMSEYDKSQMVKRIAGRLQALKNSSSYIKSVNLYIPLLSKTISDTDWFEPLSTDDFKEQKSLAANSNLPIISWDDRLLIMEMHPNPLPSLDREAVFLLSIEIDQDKLVNYLGQLNAYHTGGAAILNKNWKVTSRMDQDSLSALEQETSLALTEKNRSAQVRQIQIGNNRYYVVYEYSPILDSVLLTYTDEEQVLGPLLKLRPLLWLISGASILVVTVFSYRIYHLVHQPLSKLVRAFSKLKMGNLQVSLSHRRNDEFAFLYDRFNDMVNRLRTLIQEVYEQQIRAQRSELRQLQSQINPHFLYNSFYILHRMSTLSDTEGIGRFTKYLGDYFQFITRSDSDNVPLEMEIKHALSYVEIQNFRFYNRIRTEFAEVPEAVKGIMVPRLIVQPIVENAYKYALEGKVADGLLKVTFIYDKPRTLSIVVEDNGAGMEQFELDKWNTKLTSNDSDLEELTGIINIHRRLRIKFGPQAGAALSPSALGGMKVTLTIPNWRKGGIRCFD